MKKKFYANKFWLIMCLCLMAAASSANAFAWDKDKGKGKDRSHGFAMMKQERYHYRDGRFYKPWWFGFEFSIATPSLGVIVRSLPRGHRTIMLGGVKYNYCDGIYYRPCPSGYIVVPKPVACPNAVTVTINVPNANGSYTPVTLTKHNNGYIGPQGEYYPGHPTLEQLKLLYGK